MKKKEMKDDNLKLESGIERLKFVDQNFSTLKSDVYSSEKSNNLNVKNINESEGDKNLLLDRMKNFSLDSKKLNGENSTQSSLHTYNDKKKIEESNSLKQKNKFSKTDSLEKERVNEIKDSNEIKNSLKTEIDNLFKDFLTIKINSFETKNYYSLPESLYFSKVYQKLKLLEKN